MDSNTTDALPRWQDQAAGGFLFIGAGFFIANLLQLVRLHFVRRRLDRLSAANNDGVPIRMHRDTAFAFQAAKLAPTPASAVVSAQPGATTDSATTVSVPAEPTGVLIDGDVDKQNRVVLATARCRPHRGETCFLYLHSLMFPPPSGHASQDPLHIDFSTKSSLVRETNDAVNAGIKVLNKAVRCAKFNRPVVGAVCFLADVAVLVALILAVLDPTDVQLGHLSELPKKSWTSFFLGVAALAVGIHLVGVYLEKRAPVVITEAVLKLNQDPASTSRGLEWILQRPETAEPASDFQCGASCAFNACACTLAVVSDSPCVGCGSHGKLRDADFDYLVSVRSKGRGHT
ncbi:hypothetical protein H9P43_002086 [Blastocladiella emersonii ATCC 22665]|nr:hypothetical protein H9P43_002086 [Blastocladiella emersonii ATCC 22665]